MPHTRAVLLIGLAVAAAGAALAIRAHSPLGRNRSATVQLEHDLELIPSGPYRRIRHPIYSGHLLLFLFLGNVIMIGDCRGLLAVAIVFVSFRRKLMLEEWWLAEHFGAVHDEFRAHTEALIPHVPEDCVPPPTVRVRRHRAIKPVLSTRDAPSNGSRRSSRSPRSQQCPTASRENDRVVLAIAGIVTCPARAAADLMHVAARGMGTRTWDRATHHPGTTDRSPRRRRSHRPCGRHSRSTGSVRKVGRAQRRFGRRHARPAAPQPLGRHDRPHSRTLGAMTESGATRTPTACERVPSPDEAKRAMPGHSRVRSRSSRFLATT